MGVWPKRIFTAGIFASHTFFEGPGAVAESMIAGTVGSAIGSLCAHGMSHVLGWQSAHKIVIKRMQDIISNSDKPLENYQPFIKATQEKKYSKALRIACTSTDQKALLLVQLLLEYREKLAININEQAGADNRSALHYAALKNNKVVYHFLLQNGAVDVEDNNNTTAEQYLSRCEKAVKESAFTLKQQ